ncbi:MAG: NAD(P)-binding domain-containing protein [Steroidobacteraceae bacterium]|nr:NAD(P)-binding domain-containing protein [Steroidobacteraceae bacterium]
MSNPWIYIVYLLPLALIWLVYARRQLKNERRSAATLEEAREAGLTEPVSLHPIIDPTRCLGCGACVTACPEQPDHHVLGLINGKAQLISATDCIGHGACKIACPTDAITLVFGTETRGVTIPLLSPDFETTVPGIYVAGELGGMGLIRNALTQGRQAIEAIHKGRGKSKRSGVVDVAIIGAGPAGFGAALTATSLRMKFVCIEQESLGGCVFQYPRGKVVMTSPAELPLVGKIKFTTASKEELLKFWQDTEQRFGLKLNYQERVASVERTPHNTFLVKTSKGAYEANNVLLTIGRRGTPRKLGVPGEELPKVVYRMIDPEQYAGQEVMVVGGGDSALEAAASIAETGKARVVLSYRSDAFGRAKQRNRQRLKAGEEQGRIRVLLKSTVKAIEPQSVSLEYQGKIVRIRNDAVIVNAGGVLPNDFLRSMGIEVETKYGTA